MKTTHYEKQALIKFTGIYFFSIAFFILSLGFMYYQQQENLILQKYTMKMHQYSMYQKQNNLQYSQEGYSYQIVESNNFQYKLATKYADSYKKAFPMEKGKKFIVISVKAEIIDKELHKVKKFTIGLQIVLLVIFFTISLYLAKLSLRPLRDIISHMDRFLKDLIHDINTPTTSILLNVKTLKSKIEEPNLQKKLQRIEKSAELIGSLHENMEIVLKDSFVKTKLDLYPLLEAKKEFFTSQYPHIEIDIEQNEMEVFTNEAAISRIIDNILSNACKYSKQNGFIEITYHNKSLVIEDNGKGIRYPNKVFQRSYSEDEFGHGIGMHIVQRLCENLQMKIKVESELGLGTKVTLEF